MSKKYTIANAVKKYAPHMIEAIKKNKGNLKTNQFNALKKTMEQYWESAKVEGKGKKRTFLCEGKLKEKTKRVDKRENNKGQATLHSKHLAIHVISNLENGVDAKARTINGWTAYFGLISPVEQELLKAQYSVKARKPFEIDAIEQGIIEQGQEDAFKDIITTLNKIPNQLRTVLKHAVEINLITIVSSWQGKAKDSNEPVYIEKLLADEIKFIEAELLKRHGISKQYTLRYTNSPKTKAFNSDWISFIGKVEDSDNQEMRLQYIYEINEIRVNDNEAVLKYLKKHYPSEIETFTTNPTQYLLDNEKAYHDKLSSYFVSDAQKKHDKKRNTQLSIEEDTKEVLELFGISEEEAIAEIEERDKRKEVTPYDELLLSERYVECIKKLHDRYHGMKSIKNNTN